MLGAELSARFALPPNSRGYCGDGRFAPAFRRFLREKNAANLRLLKGAISSFRAHYAYLKLIADANGKKPFDYRVAEALWLGNGLLRNVKKRQLQSLILRDFCGRGLLGRKRAERIAASLGGAFSPHHSFHAICLHSITGVVPATIKTADSCRVGWGRVVRVGKGAVVVEAQKLALHGGRLYLKPCKKRWRTSCAGIRLLPQARIGDWVASHWGVAVVKITGKQAQRLERWTLRNVKAASQK